MFSNPPLAGDTFDAIPPSYNDATGNTKEPMPAPTSQQPVVHQTIIVQSADPNAQVMHCSNCQQNVRTVLIKKMTRG